MPRLAIGKIQLLRGDRSLAAPTIAVCRDGFAVDSSGRPEKRVGQCLLDSIVFRG